MVHDTPACSSLRRPEFATKLANVSPVNLSIANADVGVNVMDTVTFGAFATDDDKLIDEPLIAVENMAGNDPCELAAITLPEASKMAALMSKMSARALVGRLKVPNDNVSSVLAVIFASKTNLMTENENEEDRMLAP